MGCEKMTPHDYFLDHTYYELHNVLSPNRCKKIADEILDYEKHNKMYRESERFYDSIIQYNAWNLEKQGKTRQYTAIYADQIRDHLSHVYDYYLDPNVIEQLSMVAGCKLYPVPAYKTVDLTIQIYSGVGDGANWHHDRSIFNGGRCFTFLTVVYNTSDQVLMVWSEKYGYEKIVWNPCKTVLIEKFKTYHSVSPLNYGKRILLTFTYTEKPFELSLIHPISYYLNKSKNFGYIGFDAFDGIDYTIIMLITIFFAYLVAKLYKKLYNSNTKLRNTRRSRRVLKSPLK